MLADSLELNKTKIARFITTQLCCPPEVTAKLTHEIESLCSARAIMHRQVDCTRPCDSFEWFGGKYNVDFHAYVHSFDVPLYVTTTGLRMVSSDVEQEIFDNDSDADDSGAQEIWPSTKGSAKAAEADRLC
jgi:hypothetical protein